MGKKRISALLVFPIANKASSRCQLAKHTARCSLLPAKPPSKRPANIPFSPCCQTQAWPFDQQPSLLLPSMVKTDLTTARIWATHLRKTHHNRNGRRDLLGKIRFAPNRRSWLSDQRHHFCCFATIIPILAAHLTAMATTHTAQKPISTEKLPVSYPVNGNHHRRQSRRSCRCQQRKPSQSAATRVAAMVANNQQHPTFNPYYRPSMKTLPHKPLSSRCSQRDTMDGNLVCNFQDHMM
ncbi:hypothetical protein ACLOJK_008497 [Asimina triloba]